MTVVGADGAGEGPEDLVGLAAVAGVVTGRGVLVVSGVRVTSSRPQGSVMCHGAMASSHWYLQASSRFMLSQTAVRSTAI